MTELQELGKLKGQLHRLLESLPAGLREWVRAQSPEQYRELLRLETTTRFLEKAHVRHGYARAAERLMWLWSDLREQWERRK